jgi:carbon monoxide dehydrogenase subunit G
MTQIESKSVNVPAEPAKVYAYLSDLRNFKNLLPEDKISDWQAEVDSCQFKVQGGYKIGLQWHSGQEPDKIILKSTAASPFPFTLNISMKGNGQSTETQQICDADINPFLKMMVEKPLRNLFDYIADRLVKQF